MKVDAAGWVRWSFSGFMGLHKVQPVPAPACFPLPVGGAAGLQAQPVAPWSLSEALSGGAGPALGTSYSRGADPGARLPGCPGWVQETGTVGQEAPMPCLSSAGSSCDFGALWQLKPGEVGETSVLVSE